MALAPTNPDVVALAKKAHIARMKEDGFDALDEFRAMTHYNLDELKYFYRWYCNFVNPRKAPTLWGATLPNFAETFRGKPTDEHIVQLFKRFEKQNGVADLLEVFAGMAVITEAPVEDKVQFLFSIFDFSEKGDVTEDEATLAMECVCSSFVKLGLIVMPSDEELEFCSGWLFTEDDFSGSKEYVSLKEFSEWAKTAPAPLELLEMLNCVPIIESILAKIEAKTMEVTDQFDNNRTTTDDDDDNGKVPYSSIEAFKFKPAVRILVGPVIGTVTEDSAIVLLETSANASVGFQVCIAGGYDGDEVPMVPLPPDSLGFGPSRAGQQRERLVRTETVDMLARRPKSVRINGLEPSTTYRVILSGVSPDDSSARTGSFRTLAAGEGSGVGHLLQKSGYSNRYHLGAFAEAVSNGGSAIGDLNEGLSVIVVSGDAGVAVSGKDDQGSSNGGNSLSPPSEPCLWKRIWDTAVRPGRVDAIVHVGNQVSIKGAVEKGHSLMRRFESSESPPMYRPELEEGERPPLSVNDGIKPEWYRNPNIKERNALEEQVIEYFRDAYRVSWNLPHKREALAHCSNVMQWGAAELAVEQEILDGNFGKFLSRCARVVYWEYQRQLWDPDCAAPLKILLADQMGDWSLKRSEIEAVTRSIPTHEGHFHRYGHIGMLFLDVWSSRAIENGSFIASAKLFNDKQFQFIVNSLLAEDLQCVILCACTPYTGRIAGLHSVEERAEYIDTGVDVWSTYEGEYAKLMGILFQWASEKPGRNLQFLAGANEISATGEALFEDKERNRVLHQVTVGPMTGRCLSLPPEGDLRCPRHGLPAPTRILAREAINSTLKIHQVDWLGDQIWDRRNYIIMRIFCGKTVKAHTKIRDENEPEKLIGDSVNQAHVEVTIETTHGPDPSVIVGPVIGTVTSTTAIVLAEINAKGPLTCVATNVVTSQRRILTRVAEKNRPTAFPFEDLNPHSRYAVHFEGIKNEMSRRGGFTTLPTDPEMLRFIVGSADDPILKISPENKPEIWKSLWEDQFCEQWSGADAMFRLGGQVHLRGDIVQELRSLLEKHEDLYVELNQYKLATRDNKGLARVDGNTNTDCVALARGPLWDDSLNSLARKSKALPIHEIEQRILELEDTIAEKFRQRYRLHWNRPYVREVIAHCPQYMIHGGADLCGELLQSPYGPVLMRISKQVCWEYQSQLWDKSSHKGSTVNRNAPQPGPLDLRGTFQGHEGRIHRFGKVCALFIDTWSNRISLDGRFCPDRDLISPKQWDFITDAFQWNEDIDTLLVFMDMPFTGRTPAEVDQVATLKGRSWKHDEWSCRETEFVELLKKLNDWTSASKGRTVQLITGTAFIAAAGEALLRHVRTGVTVRHLAVGPLSGIAHGGLPERETPFGLLGEYSRIPMYRTFFRNYGIVRIEKSDETSSLAGGPMRAWKRTAPTTTKIRAIKSSLVTERSISDGEFDIPGANRLPEWWKKKIPTLEERSWRALIVHRTNKLVRWVNRTFSTNVHSSEMAAYQISLAYRNLYIQEPRLLESAFYDDVLDMIASGALQDENRTVDVLEKMGAVADDLRAEGSFIQIKRANAKKMHDSIVNFHKTEYDIVGLVERDKREFFYDARSQMNRIKRGIESAAARAGYTRRKGGVNAMREELVDNKDQVEQRTERRNRRKQVYDDERLAIVKVKNLADQVVQSPPPRRRQIVHVDDLEERGNETASAIRQLSDYDFNLKTIFKRENAIELKRGQINSVMVTEDVNSTMRVVQEWFEEKLEILDGEENEEVREFTNIIRKLSDRIYFLEQIDEEIKGLEDKLSGAEDDVNRCRTELDEAIEVCMEKKKVLTEVRSNRHVELLGFDRQLQQLEIEISLGDLSEITERMKNVFEHIWTAPAVIPPSIRAVLPCLNDTYMLSAVMKSTFSSTTRDPMDLDKFIDLIASVLQEAVLFKAASDAPLGVASLHPDLDKKYDFSGVGLPEGWSRHFDEKKGIEYFHHSEFGTTYVRPKA